MKASVMSHWFIRNVQVYRRIKETAWVAAGYESIGPVKCFLQSGGGTMGTTSGAVKPNAQWTMFCPADAKVIMGDKIVDEFGKVYISMNVQAGGISGTGDHMEVALEAV